MMVPLIHWEVTLRYVGGGRQPRR